MTRFDTEGTRRDRRGGARRALAVFVVAGLTACVGIGVSPSVAQNDPAPPVVAKPDELNAEQIEARIKEAESSKELDDEAKAKVLASYRAALADVQRVADYEAAAKQFEKLAADTPKRSEELRAELDALAAQDDPIVAETKPLGELELELTQRQNDLAARKAELASLEAEPGRRAARRKEIRAAAFSAPERLAETRRQLAAPPTTDGVPAVSQARLVELRARERAIEREVPALQNELAFYDAEEALDLSRLRRERLTRLVTREDRAAQALAEAVNVKRRQAADEAVQQARREAFDSHPLLKSEAVRNKELAEDAHQLTSQMESATRAAEANREALETLRKEYATLRQKVEEVGLTGPIGLLLRKQRAALDDLGALRRQVRARRELIEEVHLKLFEYDDAWTALATPETRVEAIVAQADSRLPDGERRELELAARDVIERQRDLLGTLSRNYSLYFDTLVELDNSQQQIIQLADEAARYVDERVLWIRSHQPLSPDELKRGLPTLAVLGRATNWTTSVRLLVRDVRENPIPALSGLLLFSSIFYFRRRFRVELQELGEQARRSSCREIAPTLRSLVLTALISVLWPGLMWYASWRLRVVSESAAARSAFPADALEFAAALSRGLGGAAVAYFPLEMLRQSLRSMGLARAHFGWSDRGVTVLRRQLRWLIFLVLPLSTLTGTLRALDGEQGSAVVERVAYIAMALVLSVFLQRVLRPTQGVFRDLVAAESGGWFDRLQYLWYLAGVAAPLIVAGLVAAGYFYTARQLGERLQATIGFVLAFTFLRALLQRWVLVNRRAMWMQQVQERRAAARDRKEDEDESAIPTEQPEPDLAASSEQIHRLIDVGVLAGLFVATWLAWVDVLPALKVLDKWAVWHTTVSVSETVSTANGGGGSKGASDGNVVRTVERIEPVTVADLSIAVIVTIVTVAAARNIPGLLEMVVLRQLPLDASLRYAVTTIARYLIVVLGGILGFGAIGLSWSKIQWVATALTFGLAFGLQEIFANFVAGLIILFERPIRVGDVVTVDDVTGVVSKMRIGATTIVNWDRKEFIVPNKEFITGRVLNWTLSDTTNRIMIQVGIANDADPEQARRILLEIANGHPLVLPTPPPIATFDHFGESTLNFVLRVFLGRLDDRLPVIHDLHTQIHRRFAEAGIEMPVPQRDVHLRPPPPSASGA